MYNNSREVIEEAIEMSIKIWALGLDNLARNPIALKRTSAYPSYTCNHSEMNYFWRDGYKLYQYVLSILLQNLLS